MAGAYPALHWWPTIVTAWALALMIVACALKISSHKSRSLFQTLVESFATVVLVLVGNALILGVSTWLGLLGIGLVVVIAGLLSISFFRGPAWARWTTLALHAGLVLSLLASHAYFSSLQSREGKVRYALQYGSGEGGLKPMLYAMPLAELFQLTEKSMRKGRGAEMLSEIIEERYHDIYDLEISEAEALARGPMSDPLRQRLTKIVDERKDRESQAR